MSLLTDEVVAAVGRFFTGGAGPRHNDLTSHFRRFALHDVAPYIDGAPTKEVRVRQTLRAAKGSRNERELIEALLGEMRASRCFDAAADEFNQSAVGVLGRALGRAGWTLSADGELSASGAIDLDTGGRPALEEQLKRLRRNTDDPALLIGTAKELLESVAKYVLRELDYPIRENSSFAELWHHARDRLGLLPESVTDAEDGGRP